MPLLQPRLNLKVSQRQILTPGLMQMVSVLALNKLEMTEMIQAELIENPVLEEIDESVPTLDEIGGREAQLDRHDEEHPVTIKDPFEEIDFGSYFQEYLDPGFKTSQEFEELEGPSFEQFLSQPTTLVDHLTWQLGSINLSPRLLVAVEFLVGNVDENGYLTAAVEELADDYEQAVLRAPARSHDKVVDLMRQARSILLQLDPAGVGAHDLGECLTLQLVARQRELDLLYGEDFDAPPAAVNVVPIAAAAASSSTASPHHGLADAAEQLLTERRQQLATAIVIARDHLALLQKRDLKEIARAVSRPLPEVTLAIDLIRTLDPRPGLRYNRSQARLIEPDVAFAKRGDEWAVVMNEEGMPSLRLSHRYRRMLAAADTDREVKDYVKERFRSALQLMRNIAQRKSAIVRTCEVIVRRQQDFLDLGIEHLRPMMIKEVAEEIGVHPSTVSRAVANKYAHTPQGVIELRAFFSEGSNGPEGADTPLVVLKRKVRKLIEDEDAKHPYTDDQLAALLQSQGIQVTRRTVAKYREDLNIPSTHQRRRR